ncbi:uncharacterized protein LOC118436625 [Folsomia candida]|uniref:uncharacterized protein LOC118436625 n=1 Tax=Folsomia candida TaxID=158441 RepID=UPI0016050D05|nr:uncharacterized protein LOC118436625 [Folsomia candida]
MMTTLDKKVKVQVALIQAGLILFSPGIIVLLLLGWVWRWFVLKWGAWRGEFLHPVSGLDLMFITDTPHQPHSVILMIQVLSGTPTKDRVVADLRRVYDTRDKDGKRCFWKLGTYPKEWMGYWVNKEVDNFDIENQVIYLRTYQDLLLSLAIHKTIFIR